MFVLFATFPLTIRQENSELFQKTFVPENLVLEFMKKMTAILFGRCLGLDLVLEQASQYDSLSYKIKLISSRERGT